MIDEAINAEETPNDDEEATTDVIPESVSPQQQAPELTLAPPPAAAAIPSATATGPAADTASETPPSPSTDDDQNMVHVVSPYSRADLADLEDRKYAQELARKEIKPETYQSLFAKQDTLPKIGTLFGLMLSGAGSGLAHQKNAVMEMMDNQIKNDLEAQQKTKENAQNFLRISQQIGAGMAVRKQHQAETNLIDQNTALAKARLSAMQYLTDLADKSPPGPVQDNMRAHLNELQSTVNQANSDLNKQTEGQVKAMQAARGIVDPAVKLGQEAVDYNTLNKILASETAAGLDFGGKTARAEAGKVSQNRVDFGLWKDLFNKYKKDVLAGSLNPDQRKADILAAANRLAGGSPNGHIYEEMLNSSLPDKLDSESTVRAKEKNGIHHFMSLEANTPALNALSQKFPNLKRPFPASTEGLEGGSIVPRAAESVLGGGLANGLESLKNAVLGNGKKAESKEGETKKFGGYTYKKVPGGWQKVKQ